MTDGAAGPSAREIESRIGQLMVRLHLSRRAATRRALTEFEAQLKVQTGRAFT